MSQFKIINNKLRIPLGRAVGNTSLELKPPFHLGGIWREACQEEQRTEYVCNRVCLTLDLVSQDDLAALYFCSPCSAAVDAGSWVSLAALGSEEREGDLRQLFPFFPSAVLTVSST